MPLWLRPGNRRESRADIGVGLSYDRRRPSGLPTARARWRRRFALSFARMRFVGEGRFFTCFTSLDLVIVS